MECRDGLGRGWRVGAKALERMIDESSGDAHRWLDVLLDLQDARTTLDATRAKLAEAEHELAHMRSVSPALLVTAYKQQAKRLAEVERERDAAVEQALADEREALYDMVQLRRLMDAIRARGAR